MQSLVFYGRLISRALAGSVVSDSYKDGIPSIPRSTWSSHAACSNLFHLTLAPRHKAIASSSHTRASPLHDRLLDLLSPPNRRTPGQVRVRGASFCSAAAASSDLETPVVVRHGFALKLITAKCGFAKDNFPPALRDDMTANGRSRGWMASARRRFRLREVSAPAPSPTVETRDRAACFGDDSFFVSTNTAADVLGVADGVGGWRNYGIDPSLFSSSLMATCERVVNEGRSRPDAPKTIIATGYYDLMEMSRKSLRPSSSDRSRPSGLVGSSTVCVVSFHRETHKLHTANLGDSGWAVVRDGKVIHRSTEQQHYFNTPFQLSLPPQPRQGSNSSMLQDSPEMADSASVPLMEGDVVLVATDGLWDNLDDYMILEEIESHLKNPNDEESVQRTAHALAARARELAFDPRYMSPFAKNARAAGIQAVMGGKPDDITILLSSVASR